jgi:hypothetical protein
MTKARRRRILSPVQSLQRQRIERADEDGRGAGRQQQIVEDQRALARDRREQAALLQLGARQAKSASEPPMKKIRMPE